MINFLQNTGDLANTFGFIVFSAVVAFAWAPFLIALLYRYRLAKTPKQELAVIEGRQNRKQVPEMGGLLVIITIAVLTYLFDWSRAYTWVPVGVMLLSAFLGGIDDIMNIYGRERRSRKIGQAITLIRVHKEIRMRIWYAVTLPWTAFKRLSAWLGSRPGKGIFVHEKLILQFIAGATAAWWIYAKLGPAWDYFYTAVRAGNISRRVDNTRRHFYRHVHGQRGQYRRRHGRPGRWHAHHHVFGFNFALMDERFRRDRYRKRHRRRRSGRVHLFQYQTGAIHDGRRRKPRPRRIVRGEHSGYRRNRLAIFPRLYVLY